MKKLPNRYCLVSKKIAIERQSTYCAPMSETDLFEAVLQLPPAARASLVEKIVESIVADIEPDVESAHLEEVDRRRREVLSGQSQLVQGDEVLQRARSLLRQ